MTARLHHIDLYGSRKSKSDALYALDLQSINWQDLSPNQPYYLFVPQEQANREEYEAWPKVTEVFPVNGMGVTAGDSKRHIAFAERELISRIDDGKRHYVVPVAFRCFDTRVLYFDPSVLARARTSLMRHMLSGRNIALATLRRPRNAGTANFFVSGLVTGKEYISSLDNAQIFPLWLYPTVAEAGIGLTRRANIAPKILSDFSVGIGREARPEEVFHYAYAVFHSPTYRSRFAAFLRTDFPRLPPPPDASTFEALAELGAKLTALHLLEAPELDRHGIGYSGGGSHIVKKMRLAERYMPATSGRAGGIVRINDIEQFENVPAEAWSFRIGGYHPASKWLEDRTARTLTEDDINHYRRMIAAMRDTAAMLPGIDEACRSVIAGSVAEAPE